MSLIKSKFTREEALDEDENSFHLFVALAKFAILKFLSRQNIWNEY